MGGLADADVSWKSLAEAAEQRAEAASAREAQVRLQLQEVEGLRQGLDTQLVAAEASCRTLQSRMQEWGRALSDTHAAVGRVEGEHECDAKTDVKTTEADSANSNDFLKSVLDSPLPASGQSPQKRDMHSVQHGLQALASLVRELRSDNCVLDRRAREAEQGKLDMEAAVA